MDDSIPADILLQWNAERSLWLEQHPKPWSGELENEYHRRFSNKIDRYLDEGHGSCSLSVPDIAAIVTEYFQYFNQQRYLLHTFVIMPNHVHLLFSTHEETDLATIISTWKRFSATRINRVLGRRETFWQRDYFDRIIRNWDHFIAVARYIQRNPLKAKLTLSESHFYTAPWVGKLLS